MQPQPPQRRLFTLDDATRMMPTVREIVSRLQQRKRELETAGQRLAELTPAMRGNGSAVEAGELGVRIERLRAQLAAGMDELGQLGVEIRDIDAGLVDFPSIRGGRVVYLCWLVTEEEIGFWHDLDAGFAGRRRLSEGGEEAG